MSILLNILLPILGSSGILGILMFLFKKQMERKIEHRFKQIELQQKLQLEEAYRRQSMLYDEQFGSYKLLSAITYRLKNSSQTLLDLAQHGSIAKHITDELKIFRNCLNLLSEALYADQLIMEDDVFSVVHDLKHACAAFLHDVEYYEARGAVRDLYALEFLKDQIENGHFQALSMYKKSIERSILTQPVVN